MVMPLVVLVGVGVATTAVTTAVVVGTAVAGKKGCNPCAAKNPCAVKNPCAAKGCNPCAAGATVELTDAEAAKVYDCMIGEMQAGYAKSGFPVSNAYQGWTWYSKVACVSGTHGNRLVQNYGNAKAKAYGKFEDTGRCHLGERQFPGRRSRQSFGRPPVFDGEDARRLEQSFR